MYFKKSQIHTALQLLKERVEQDNYWSGVGICSNLSRILESQYPNADIRDIIAATETYVSRIARDWFEYSGNDQYPVPCVNDTSPMHEYRFSQNLWAGEYGAARKRLLDFLIERTR